MVVLPDGSRAPSGGGSAGGLPCQYIPADANGGLCIGRSHADHRGAWGTSATNKRHRVYTGALLATTANSYERWLKSVCNDSIIGPCQFDKSMFEIMINNRRKQIMYTYKTEILSVGTKWFSDKADSNDIEVLDQLINERAADGWELVTYDYMATSMQIRGAFVITFRKQQ